MRKVLFIGIQRFYMRGLLRNLPERKLKGISEFLANTPDEAIQIAKENPDISVVLFLGYLFASGSEDPFRANVGVAIELNKILARKVMIAATRDDVDEELMKNGCTIKVPVLEVGNFLRDQL